MRRDEHGFSLMELLLVLALVSVIVAMACACMATESISCRPSTSMAAVASYWLTAGNVASTVWTLFCRYRISDPRL